MHTDVDDDTRLHVYKPVLRETFSGDKKVAVCKFILIKLLPILTVIFPQRGWILLLGPHTCEAANFKLLSPLPSKINGSQYMFNIWFRTKMTLLLVSSSQTKTITSQTQNNLFSETMYPKKL